MATTTARPKPARSARAVQIRERPPVPAQPKPKRATPTTAPAKTKAKTQPKPKGKTTSKATATTAMIAKAQQLLNQTEQLDSVSASLLLEAAGRQRYFKITPANKPAQDPKPEVASVLGMNARAWIRLYNYGNAETRVALQALYAKVETCSGNDIFWVDLAEFDTAVELAVEALVEDSSHFAPGQQAKLTRWLDRDAALPIKDAHGFFRRAQAEARRAAVEAPGVAAYEWCVGGRWYPVTLKPSYFRTWGEAACVVKIAFQLGGRNVETGFRVGRGLFLDTTGGSRFRTFDEALADLGLRRRGDYTVAAAHDLAQRELARAWNEKIGTQVVLRQSALELVTMGWELVPAPVDVGTPENPEHGVIDGKYEAAAAVVDGDDEDNQPWPVVRVFHLYLKRYVFVPVDAIEEYVYTPTAFDRLVMPETKKAALTTIFANATNAQTNQALHGRSSHSESINIIAYGPPGSGKTATCIAAAEVTGRPIYRTSLYELGFDSTAFEARFQRILNRVVRWNAILLVDECDSMWSKRNGDLEHDAVVAMLLQAVERFKGIMFLTTNLIDRIDPALLSRCAMQLRYEALDDPGRTQVWRNNLAQAPALAVENGVPGWLGTLEVDGRRIEKVVQLIKTLHPGEPRITGDVFRSRLALVLTETERKHLPR